MSGMQGLPTSFGGSVRPYHDSHYNYDRHQPQDHPRQRHREQHQPEHHNDCNEDQDQPQPPMHMHVPPKGHGPRLQTHVPTFVRAQGVYDDLGRLVGDGSGAGVPGVNGGKKEMLGKEGVVDFWKRLDWGPLGVSGGSEASGSGSSGSRDTAKSFNSGTAKSATSPSGHTISPHKDDSSASHSSQLNPSPPAFRTIQNLTPTSTPTPTPGLNNPKPLQPHVPRSEWFIRKALLKKAEKEQREAEERLRVKEEWEDEVEVVSPSNSDGDAVPLKQERTTILNSNSHRPTRPSSLVSLLTLPPPGIKPYEPPTHFHIRPDNVGYKLLAKGGWSGIGGLGRPVGWEEAGVVKTEIKSEPEEGRDVWETRGEGGNEVVEVVPEVIDVDAVIDLTELEDEETDDDAGRPIDVDDPSTGPSKFGDQQLVLADLESSQASSSSLLVGPGRVAPVATYLKNDLAGIGHIPQHRRAVLAPRVIREKDGESDPDSKANKKKMKKRVTHTLADIKAMQRGKVGPGLSEEEMEKRRRGRAKRDAKRDREERKRWMEIISA